MITHWYWAICEYITEGDVISMDIEDVTCDECLGQIISPKKQILIEEDDE
jgi:hypothetical protein